MKTIVNQLNKVKLSDTSDIEAQSVYEFLTALLENERSIENKSVVILNSESGILHVGISLLFPKMICSIVQLPLNATQKANISTFNVSCDFILSKSCPFKSQSMDLAILGPLTDKSNCTDLSYIETSTKFAKTTYCLFKSEHKKLFLNKFPDASDLGTLSIRNPESSKYQKQNGRYTEYIIFKVSVVTY